MHESINLSQSNVSFIELNVNLFLDSVSKSNSHIAHVEFRIEFANENISQNPPGSHWEFKTKESRNTLSLSQLGYLKENGHYLKTCLPRDWSPKFKTGLIFIIGIVQKV